MVGGLSLNNKVNIDRNTITADNWGNVLSSNNLSNPVGWVSMTYIKLDPVVPPTPPAIDEKAYRIDEARHLKEKVDKVFDDRIEELK